jgi:hypothetical protein
MEGIRWLFDNPFNHTHSMLTLLSIVGVLSVGFALFARRMEWMGAAALVAFIGSFGFFLTFTILHRFGPLSLMGLGMMFIAGVMVALPTVGVIRVLMRWLGGKSAKAD